MAKASERLDKAARVASRKTWPVRIYRLGEEPSDDLSEVTTAAQRLEVLERQDLDPHRP
jgi:hypothetical protein